MRIEHDFRSALVALNRGNQIAQTIRPMRNAHRLKIARDMTTHAAFIAAETRDHHQLLERLREARFRRCGLCVLGHAISSFVQRARDP